MSRGGGYGRDDHDGGGMRSNRGRGGYGQSGGRSPYDRNSSYQNGDGGRGKKELGGNLRHIEWDISKLIRFEKDFYKQTAKPAARYINAIPSEFSGVLRSTNHFS